MPAHQNTWRSAVLIALLIVCGSAAAWEAIDLRPFADSAAHWQKKYGRDRQDGHFDPADITTIGGRMLAFQNEDGGWPKDLDYQTRTPEAEIRRLRGDSLLRSTLDNRSTYPQTSYLAQVFTQTRDPQYRLGAERGLDFILRTQHDSGGWRGADVDAITFNDDVMVGAMSLLRDIAGGADHFTWLDDARRAAVAQALARAVAATLRCQIEVNGIKTAWCQQHSHADYRAVKARAYELPSICAQESVGVVRFLMSLPGGDPAIHVAIESAVAWLRRSAIQGIRIDTVDIAPVRFENHTATQDRIAVADPQAPPIWTRYYEIETNRPFFCNRDGVKVYSLAEVALERRTGYGWYTGSPQTLLDVDYPAWNARSSR